MTKRSTTDQTPEDDVALEPGHDVAATPEQDATAKPDPDHFERPTEGGSWVRQDDGTLTREQEA